VNLIDPVPVLLHATLLERVPDPGEVVANLLERHVQLRIQSLVLKQSDQLAPELARSFKRVQAHLLQNPGEVRILLLLGELLDNLDDTWNKRQNLFRTGDDFKKSEHGPPPNALHSRLDEPCAILNHIREELGAVPSTRVGAHSMRPFRERGQVSEIAPGGILQTRPHVRPHARSMGLGSA
jgi:hypothetical protein